MDGLVILDEEDLSSSGFFRRQSSDPLLSSSRTSDDVPPQVGPCGGTGGPCGGGSRTLSSAGAATSLCPALTATAVSQQLMGYMADGPKPKVDLVGVAEDFLGGKAPPSPPWEDDDEDVLLMYPHFKQWQFGTTARDAEAGGGAAAAAAAAMEDPEAMDGDELLNCLSPNNPLRLDSDDNDQAIDSLFFLEAVAAVTAGHVRRSGPEVDDSDDRDQGQGSSGSMAAGFEDSTSTSSSSGVSSLASSCSTSPSTSPPLSSSCTSSCCSYYSGMEDDPGLPATPDSHASGDNTGGHPSQFQHQHQHQLQQQQQQKLKKAKKAAVLWKQVVVMVDDDDNVVSDEDCSSSNSCDVPDAPDPMRPTPVRDPEQRSPPAAAASVMARAEAEARKQVGHCNVCNLVFSSEAQLAEHRLAYAQRIACCHCCKIFSTPSKLRVHHRKHSKEKLFQCLSCGKHYTHKQTLARHQLLYCPLLRAKVSSAPDDKAVPAIELPDGATLPVVVDDEDDEKEEQVLSDVMVLDLVDSLEGEAGAVFLTSPESGGRLLARDISGLLFPATDTFRRRPAGSSSLPASEAAAAAGPPAAKRPSRGIQQRPPPVSRSGLRTTTTSTTTSSPDKGHHKHQHVCRICEKSFADEKGLNGHTNHHLSAKACCRCQRVLGNKSKLLTHHRSHTKELPYVCQVCDKGFAENSTLRKHAATHGERKFSCSFCSKAFVRKDYLAKHALTHRQTFKCSLCSFECHDSSDIERHVSRSH